MNRYDDPTALPTIAYGIVLAVLVFVTIVALQALFNRMETEEFQKKIVAEAPEELDRLVAEQEEELNSYRWIDQKTGVAAIPIERAMEIAERELNAGAAASMAVPVPGAQGR